jgi:hypothetical protein
MIFNENFKLLICIAFFTTPERENLKNTYQYLEKVICNIRLNYKCNFNIVIHTNSQKSKERIEKDFPFVKVILRPVTGIYTAENLQSESANLEPLPFGKGALIAFQHRKYIFDNLDNYDAFLYIEDDILIPYDALLNYLNNFNLLWPNHIPSFFRYEINSDQKKCSPDHDNFFIKEENLLFKNDKVFYSSPVRIYSACWAIPAKILKEVIDDSFIDIDKLVLDNHKLMILEWSASYVNWTLRHKFGISNCLELKKENLKYLLSDDILVHHLPNKYVNKPIQEWTSKSRHHSLRTLESILK